jgi:hypothetical protein
MKELKVKLKDRKLLRGISWYLDLGREEFLVNEVHIYPNYNHCWLLSENDVYDQDGMALFFINKDDCEVQCDCIVGYCSEPYEGDAVYRKSDNAGGLDKPFKFCPECGKEIVWF